MNYVSLVFQGAAYSSDLHWAWKSYFVSIILLFHYFLSKYTLELY